MRRWYPMNDVVLVSIIELAEEIAANAPGVRSVQLADLTQKEDGPSNRMELVFHFENGQSASLDLREAIECGSLTTLPQKINLWLSLCLTN